MAGTILGASLAVCLGGASAASAQSLEEILAYTYQTNPTLNAARASLRVTDEGVARAKGGWRPQVTSNLGVGYTDYDAESSSGTTSGGSSYPKTASLSVVQPLYRGGRVEAAIKGAEYQVQASRAEMFATEQRVLLDAVTAYMNVIRDESVLQLQGNNLERLKKQLEATRDRFEVGEVTRTDVAQAEARVARANADLIQAQGGLVSSRVNFEKVVGLVPETLAGPKSPEKLPDSREMAVEEATRNNFNLISAKFSERRAIEDIDLVFGELLPTMNLVGSADYDRDTNGSDNEVSQFTLQAQVSIPIYQQGTVSARVRAAKEEANRIRIVVESIRREAVDTAARAYESWQTTLARIVALEASVRSAEIALEGVQQEATVGARTVLDVLDAEQELLDAQVALVSAQRDELVASYNLLSSVGRLTAADLGLDVEYYDYDQHYREVSNKLWGTDTPGKAP